MNNGNAIIFGIICYILSLKIFGILYSIIRYIGLNNDYSMAYYYVTMIVVVVFSIWLLRLVFLSGSRFLNNQHFIYIAAILVFAFACLDQFIGYKLSMMISEKVSDINILMIPEEIKGRAFIGLHLLLIIAYKWMFNSKEKSIS